MTVSETEVGGWVAPGFEGVREAFAENFRSRGDKGASLGVYVDGEAKVDLWGGVADVSTGRPWAADSVSVVYSATKGATAWWRRRTGIEPASDAARRSLVLKTRGTTRFPDASGYDSTREARRRSVAGVREEAILGLSPGGSCQ